MRLYDWGWNWDGAIEQNRSVLLRVLMGLFALARISSPGGTGAMLPRYIRSYIIRLLRPAESAGRRLIVLYSLVHALKVPVLAKRASPVLSGSILAGDGKGPAVFPLRDVRKCFDRPARRKGRKPIPRLTIIGLTERIIEEIPVILPEDELDAKSLFRRMDALKRALDDLPKEAKRLMGVEARREMAPPGPGRRPALRLGLPPGHRQRQIHEVDEVLAETRLLVRYALTPAPS